MTKRTRTYRVTEGRYTAEVEIEVEEGDRPWMPWVTGEEAQKLDAVRLALRRGDVATAQKLSRTLSTKHQTSSSTNAEESK